MLLRQLYCTFLRYHRIWSTELVISQMDKSMVNKIITPELLSLDETFKRHNFQIRIAGGAVRDLLMNKIPEDIDFATTATPQEMIEMFEKESIRMFNNNGIKHGTVSVRINDKENFEITTLRVDVRTFGRHADVEFTTDWMIDANRRDLTINSLFLDLSGKIYDYFDGVEHIKDRIVKFVGDASVRIEEDYLRILRYFRFFGVMNAKSHDDGVLDVIKHHGYGLEGISGERIWTEMKKILIGPLAPHILQKMNECCILKFIGLQNTNDTKLSEFESVYNRAIELKPQPITMLCSLLSNETDLIEYHKRTKLSNDEYDIALILMKYRELPIDMKFLLDTAVEMDARNHSKIKEKISELIKYKGLVDLLASFNNATIPKFPINGLILASIGVKQGPKYSSILYNLRQLWKKSNFEMTQDELLAKIDQVLNEADDGKGDFVLEARKRKRLSTKC